MGYLKTSKALIEALGETLEIVELNAFGYRELQTAYNDGDLILATAVAVKYGTKVFADLTPEEIMQALPLNAIQEISDKVTDLSAIADDDDDAGKE